MIQQSGVLLVALKSVLITEILIPRWRIAPFTASSMPTPFQSTVPQVIKIEDEGNSAPHGQGFSEQELMDMFRKGVQRRLDLRKKQGHYGTSGNVNPAPPPPANQSPPLALLPPPPLPPPPPAAAAEHHTGWAKRPAPGSPPGFHGVRPPPQKRHQRKPPWERAHQHSGPNGHRGPPPPTVHVQQLAPPPNGHRGPPLPVHNNSSDVVNPNPKRRPAPTNPPPTRAGAAGKKKRPSVACGVCGVLCMTTWHLKDHEQGRKHRNKVACLAGQMNVRCQVCNVHLSGALNVEQHYAGKQHLWRLNGGA